MTNDESSKAGDAAGCITAYSNNSKIPATSFTDFNLHDELQTTLFREGLVKPTSIQQLSIPVLLEGKDLIGLAQTGSGKTAAFLLPILTRLDFVQSTRSGQPPKALILAPTRELASQISTNLSRLAKKMNIRHITVFGGARYDSQIKKLRRGVDVVVATPGRLIDLMERRAFDPSGISHLVLDEADHMLDLGFYDPIKRIVCELPKDRQTMLFSATMPPMIEKLGNQFLIDPVRVKAPQTGVTAEKVTQQVTLIPESQKRDRLCMVLNDKNTGQCLIFVRTKRRADALSKFMQTRGFSIDALHGDMRQGLRQKVLSNFRNKKLQSLIATDVAARGIDIANLSHVVNFDLTDTPLAYIHRIGRTGRAGLGGLALSFCSPSEEQQLASIISLVGPKVEVYDPDGQSITNFQAETNTYKRSQGSRSKRWNKGKRKQGDGLHRRRNIQGSQKKLINRSQSKVKPTRTNKTEFLEIDENDRDFKTRPKKSSRPIEINQRSTQRKRKDTRDEKKTFGQKNKKGENKSVKKNDKALNKQGSRHLRGKKNSVSSYTKPFSENNLGSKIIKRQGEGSGSKRTVEPARRAKHKQGGNRPLRRKRS